MLHVVALVGLVTVVGCTDRGDPVDASGGAIDSGVVDAAEPRDALRSDVPWDAPPPDATCASVRVDTSRETPNVILIVDRSGSMNQPFGGGLDRWEALQEALVGTDGLVPSLDSQIRFGGMVYWDEPEEGACPDTVERAAALDAAGTMSSLIASAGVPAANTPTGDTIALALSRIDTLAPTHDVDPTVFVLATDGEPGTCEESWNNEAGKALSVANVEMAHAMGIDTYVLSVGREDELGMAHLQDVANAGLGRVEGDEDAPYWVASDPAGLETALATIVRGVLSCTLELDGTIETAFACDGTVTLGDETLECGTDWRALDGTHIEILGEACDRLRGSLDDLVATFPCDVLI